MRKKNTRVKITESTMAKIVKHQISRMKKLNEMGLGMDSDEYFRYKDQVADDMAEALRVIEQAHAGEIDEWDALATLEEIVGNYVR